MAGSTPVDMWIVRDGFVSASVDKWCAANPESQVFACRIRGGMKTAPAGNRGLTQTPRTSRSGLMLNHIPASRQIARGGAEIG